MTLCENVTDGWSLWDVRHAGLSVAFPPRMTTQKSRRNVSNSCSVGPMGAGEGSCSVPGPALSTWLLKRCSQLHWLEAADRMSHQTTHRSQYNSNGMETALDFDTCHTVEAEHPQSKNPNVPESFWVQHDADAVHEKLQTWPQKNADHRCCVRLSSSICKTNEFHV